MPFPFPDEPADTLPVAARNTIRSADKKRAAFRGASLIGFLLPLIVAMLPMLDGNQWEANQQFLIPPELLAYEGCKGKSCRSLHRFLESCACLRGAKDASLQTLMLYAGKCHPSPVANAPPSPTEFRPFQEEPLPLQPGIRVDVSKRWAALSA